MSGIRGFKSMAWAAAFAAVTAFSAVSQDASASTSIVRVSQSSFVAGSGLITFSEFAPGTVNPTYLPINYGGGAGSPTVTFEGYFSGQSMGVVSSCPAGAAVSGCVVGSPSGPISLASGAPNTFITGDGANPTSPVLSGNPIFNGPIAILFNVDVAGVGLDGGFFDAIGGTAITAYRRNGTILGSVLNTGTGIEFLGLVTNDGAEDIAGLLFSLAGPEPAGFAIDNLRFGRSGEVTAAIPEPETYAMLLAGLGLLGFVARRRKQKEAAALA